MYSLDILHDIEKFAEEVKSGAHLRTPRHLQPESNPFDLEWQRVYDAYGQAGWLNVRVPIEYSSLCCLQFDRNMIFIPVRFVDCPFAMTSL